MPKQPVIPGLRDALKKKVTRREQFLAEMECRGSRLKKDLRLLSRQL